MSSRTRKARAKWVGWNSEEAEVKGESEQSEAEATGQKLPALRTSQPFLAPAVNWLASPFFPLLLREPC